MWNMCLCRRVCLLCALAHAYADLPTGCSSSATFEREGDPRRWYRMCRGETWNCETLAAPKINIVRIFGDFWNSKKKTSKRYHEDMKICVLEAVEVILDARTCVASEGRRQFGDVGPRQSAATCFCLRSCHGRSVCLDVWKSVQVLKLSKQEIHHIWPLIYVCNIQCSFVCFQLIQIDLI